MIAIYTRLSIEEEDSNSISNQIREGKAYAYLNGYNDDQIRIYNEGEGVKGSTDIKDRPALNSMMTDIKNGLIDVVWARKQSRISRKLKIFNQFIEDLIDYKIKLYMGDRGLLDLDSPTTKMMLQILSSVDEFAPNHQSNETKRALRDSANEGKVWGVIPYGYSTDDNKQPIVNSEQAKVIKEIFQLSLKGWGVRRIATFLDKKGIPTKYNGYQGTLKVVNRYDKSIVTKDYKDILWSPKTVLEMLRNTWYIGTRTYSGVEYPVPPIIDISLFDRVGENLKTNNRNSGKKVEYRYLLKGLIRCAKCGRNYYGRTRAKKNDNFYMCSSKRIPSQNCGNKSLSIPYLETFIIKHLFESKDLLTHLETLEKNDNSLNELKEELSIMSNNLKKEYRTNERLANLLLDDNLSDDQLFIKKYNTSKTQISDFKGRITAIEQRIKERTSNDRITAYKEEKSKVDLTNFTTLKQSVNNVIERIEIMSGVDKNKVAYYLIEIKYRGYDETSLFTTAQPYDKWIYISNTYPDPNNEDIKEDIEIYKFAFGVELSKNEYLDKNNQDFYSNPHIDNIHIEKKELIEFN